MKQSEKAFLIYLAEMEDVHEKTFDKMHQDFNKLDKEQQMVDPDGQAVLYLKAIADTKIFFKKDPPGKDMENILHSAIRSEQDSVIFYLGMCELVSDAHGKDYVDEIIKEELEHIRLLAMKLTELGLQYWVFSNKGGYYGEKCFEYLFGDKWTHLYRYLRVLFVFVGAMVKLDWSGIFLMP